MKHSSFLTIASLAIASLPFLTSCQDEDFGFTKNEIRESVYDRNFLKKYGDLCTPDQDWDFTAYGQLVKNRSNATLTRATPTRVESTIPSGGDGTGMKGVYESKISCSTTKSVSTGTGTFKVIESSDYDYTVPSDIVNWLDTNLKEEVNNKAKYSQKFTMIGTDCESFYLIPLYQGKAGMNWELHAVMEKDGQSYDIKVWERSDGIKVGGNTINKSQAYYLQNTIGASSIQSKIYEISGIIKGASISFYLHITHGQVGDAYRSAQSGREFWSDSRTQPQWNSSNMVVLPIDIPTGMETYARETGERNNDIMIFGVEDAFKGKGASVDYKFQNIDYTGDDDLNDIVFLLVGGPKLPGIVDENNIQKRYLVEDLGSLVDWDFNDVVVDFFQHTDYQGNVSQKAYLRHRCGTTPFEVYLKDGENNIKLNFSQIDTNNAGQINGVVQDRDVVTSYEATIEGNKWNPETNNVFIKVYPDERYNGTTGDEMDSNYVVYTVAMPDHSKGNNIPKVLCVDVDTWWTDENDEFIEAYLNKSQDVEKPDNVDVPIVTPSTPDNVKTYPYLENGTNMVILDEIKTASGYQTVSVSKAFRDALSEGYTILHIELEDSSDKTIQIALFNEEIDFEDNKFVIDTKKNLTNISTDGNDYKWDAYKWSATNNSITVDLTNGIAVRTLTSDNKWTVRTIDYIVDNELRLGMNSATGSNGVKVNKIYLTKPTGGNSGTTIWSGSQALAWSNWEIKNNISANDIIKIDYNASSDGQMQVYNGGWDANNDKETKTITTDSQTHTVTVTAKGTWIVLQGQNCTVTRIYK